MGLIRRHLAVLCALAALAVPAAAQTLDATPRIAVLSAFEPEWQGLKAGIEDPTEHVDTGITYVTGKLEGRDVVLFLSGIGMVNAAMTTQLALDRFNITALVFSGIAGGVDPDLNLGDIVVAEAFAPYLHMVLAREVDGDYAVPPMFGKPFANYGMMFPQMTDVRRKGESGSKKAFWFDADPALLAIAEKAAGEVALADCDGEGVCLTLQPKVIVGGKGVSGSAFVDNADFRRYVFATFEAKLLDMESAAVAQVAYTNAVPFIAIRSLSDLAGGGEGENEIGTFFRIAVQNSTAMLRAFLRASAEEAR